MEEDDEVYAAAPAATPSRGSASPETPLRTYRAVQGDDIDQAIAQVLRETGYYNKINVSRISHGLYTFEDKRMVAVIKNGRVLLRVGGGFMALEEYIERFGQD